MTISRGQITKQLIPGLNKVFGTSYKSVVDEHSVLFDKEKSNRSFEEEVLFSGLGAAPEKYEGQSIFYDDMRETYKVTYNHVTVALGFAITEEAVEDNLYPEMSKMRAQALGRAMAVTKETRAADVYNNGFNSAYLGGDGVVLFSNAHPTLSGNQTNIPSSHVDLSETTLEQAIIDIAGFKDERGIQVNAQAKSLHIPPALQFTACKILDSTLSTTTATNSTTGVTNVNDINALRVKGIIPGGYHVNHRFTDTDAWFIRTDVPNGMKHFVRVGLETGDEGDFDTGNYRYKARERYSFGWSDWRAVYGTTGTG